MDGRLLALAREEKEQIRRRSLAEDERRRQAAYARIPALRQIDARLAELVGEVASSVLGGGRPLGKIRAESLELLGQRAERLTENGFAADWLDGAWDCPDCQDTGFVEGRMCRCLRALYDEQRTKDLSALLKLGSESFETFDLSYYDGVPGAREKMERNLRVCRAYAENFGPSSVNLLFRGGTGLGKTFLSACIARVVSEKGFSVVYATVVEAMAAYEDQKFRDDPDAGEKIERLQTCDLLILDDLGTEMVTEFTKSALYTLINTRLLAGKKTVISTNLTAGELERAYTQQIRSRLTGEYQDVPFVGRDIRLIRKERGL